MTFEAELRVEARRVLREELGDVDLAGAPDPMSAVNRLLATPRASWPKKPVGKLEVIAAAVARAALRLERPDDVSRGRAVQVISLAFAQLAGGTR